MRKRVCRIVGCPTIIPGDAYRGLCDQHRKQRDQQRGTRAQRGYDAAYDRARRDYKRRIDAGETILCWRCSKPVSADFHLGHDDDRNIIGPEHPDCNLRAAGIASHQ